MITISQTPIDFNIFVTGFTQNSIEFTILNILQKSSFTYDYSSMDELKFELALRREIVNAAIALNKSSLNFAIFRKTRCNEKYWQRTSTGGFLLKQNVKPSEAVRDIYINGNLYATECATAMVIVYYKALLDTMGEATFNKLFTRIELMNWHNIDRRLSEISTPVFYNDYLPGDRRYFKNPDVDPKTPEWQGENVIDLSNGLYYGHGIGATNGNNIIKNLNNNRRNDASQSAYLMDSAGRPNFKRLFSLTK